MPICSKRTVSIPPSDFAKWARICEHVVRHYNEGWAGGYHYALTYWEIWNEPDDCYREETAAMWKGTAEEYFRLYAVTAKHLKACFGDTIRVGGYGSCGVYEYAQDTTLTGLGHEDRYIYDFTISFLHRFLSFQKEAGAPLDFFSWHVYDNCHASTREDIAVIREHAQYVRRVLDHYGYQKTESHLNEWNLYTHKRHRDAPEAASRTLAFMLMMQNTPVDLMCYYDGGVGYSDYRGLIDPSTGYPYRNYYAFMMFHALYQMQTLAPVTVAGGTVWAQAAMQGKRGTLVLANPTGEDVALSLDLRGFPLSYAELLRIDD